jgi:hypothetical protein
MITGARFDWPNLLHQFACAHLRLYSKNPRHPTMITSTDRLDS